MEMRKLPTIFVAGGCIAVVALVLAPIFLQREIPPRRYSCLSNIKQMGFGLLMYAQDYDERFPRAAQWMDATYPYIKSKSVYRCMALDKSHRNDFGYAFNSDLGLKSPVTLKAPEKIVTLYDASNLLWNAHAPDSTGVANPPRHAEGNAMGFVDSHAKWQKPMSGAE